MPKMCCGCSQNYYCDFVKDSSAGMASVNVNKKEVKRTVAVDDERRTDWTADDDLLPPRRPPTPSPSCSTSTSFFSNLPREAKRPDPPTTRTTMPFFFADRFCFDIDYLGTYIYWSISLFLIVARDLPTFSLMYTTPYFIYSTFIFFNKSMCNFAKKNFKLCARSFIYDIIGKLSKGKGKFASKPYK